MPEPWRLLVSPDELVKRLEKPAEDLLLLDCRHSLTDPETGPRAYEEGHIPGAVHAHVDRDLSGPVTATTGRHPLPSRGSLEDRLAAWGLTPETQVVAYDDMGGAFAARAWWLLRHHGHDKVAVLDGGLPLFTDAGGRLTKQVPQRRHTEVRLQSGRLPVVQAHQLEQEMPVEPGRLLDARDPERYRGEVEPIDPVAGHIPGALNVPFKQNLTKEGRFRDAVALRALYEAVLGSRDPRETAVYCGSGVTAVHNILAMEVAGLKGAALYPGSWSEWVTGEDRPVAKGGR